MRVITGTAKGVRLAAPAKGLAIRPTLDRVRESLFGILGPRIEDARFLDLFAGTGANGIEALSRGAKFAVFVDRHPKALGLIRENLQRTKLNGGASCHRLQVPRDLRHLEGPFDLIYADPPYDLEDHEALLQAVCECALLAPGGTLILEHSKRSDLPDKIAAVALQRAARYGETTLSFFADAACGIC